MAEAIEFRPLVYTVRRAAAELGIGERTIWRGFETGTIKKVQLSARRVGVPLSEVIRISEKGIGSVA